MWKLEIQYWAWMDCVKLGFYVNVRLIKWYSLENPYVYLLLIYFT